MAGTKTETAVGIVANYANGKFCTPESAGSLDAENPCTGEVIARVPLSTAAAVSQPGGAKL